MKPTRMCTVQDCHNRAKARGLCNKHYLRMRKHGGVESPGRTQYAGSLADRFWPRVEKGPNCWEWTGARGSSGYGQISSGGPRPSALYAHRVSYELAVGPIPEGMQIDHTCHNSACVNPEHLRIVTLKQNAENLAGPYKNNTTGYRGVSRDKSGGKYVARVTHNGREYSRDGFHTAHAAAEWAREKRLELFTHNDADRRTYGRCDYQTHHAGRYGPAEWCEADTHPAAAYCPAHGGPDPDDTNPNPAQLKD